MLTRFAAAAIALAFISISSSARADDWLEKAFKSSNPVTTVQANSTRKATRDTRARTAAVDSTAGQRKPARSQTYRAARTDDARPSLQRRAAAPVTSGGEYGVASYYWQPQPVASGGRFNPEAMTAAHKTLPFGTRVRVTRLDTGRSVEVTINDRGPYIAGRIIDLSRRAARDIGMTDVGLTRVSVNVLGR